MYLIIGVAGIFITAIMGYGFYASSRINVTDVPLVEATMKVKLEAAVANLLLEELIAEGMALNFDAVWENLDRAMRSFQEALAQSGPNFLIFGAGRRPVIQREFDDMAHQLTELKKSARQRLAEGTKPFLSPDTERRYRENYDAFLGKVNGLEHKLRLDLTQNLETFASYSGSPSGDLFFIVAVRLYCVYAIRAPKSRRLCGALPSQGTYGSRDR